MISEILGKEEEVYKTALSRVKSSNPQVKVWTMNTPDMVVRAEHIQSGEKVSSLYSELPPKLGFKLIPLSKFKKVLDTRKIKSQKEIVKMVNDEIVGSGGIISRVAEAKESIIKYINSSYFKDVANSIADTFVKEIGKKNPDTLNDIISRQVDDDYNDYFDSDDANMEDYNTYSHFIHQLGENTTAILLKYSDKSVFDIKKIETETAERIFENGRLFAIQLRKELEKDKEGTSDRNIWWANRGMLNEDKMIFSQLVEGYK